MSLGECFWLKRLGAYLDPRCVFGAFDGSLSVQGLHILKANPDLLPPPNVINRVAHGTEPSSSGLTEQIQSPQRGQ